MFCWRIIKIAQRWGEPEPEPVISDNTWTSKFKFIVIRALDTGQHTVRILIIIAQGALLPLQHLCMYMGTIDGLNHLIFTCMSKSH